MSISFSGLASGLDTSSWVESLVALKKAKVTTLEEEKKEVQSLQETLSQIKSFFSSFRSMLEKVTDAKFGVASMDLFAQNLATSSNLEALTASATTEAEEATYNVLVDKLASETKANSNYSYMTTIVQTTTATGDSKLINLGVKTGNIGVTVNGVEHGINITENDTLSTFIEKLKNIGVNASFNEDSGIFSIDVSADAINDIDKTGIKDALHLSGVNEGYTSDSLKTSRTDTIFSAATETTKLSELGVKDGIVTITANGANYSISINGTTTLGEFIEELNKNHIDATLDKDGVFTISDAEITNEGTTDIKNALGLDSSIYGKSQVTGNLTHQTTITQTTLATSDTLLKDLEGGENIKDGDTVIVKNSNNEYTTITVGTSTTLGDLLEGISNAGLYAARKADGTIEITGGTIEGGTFKAEDVLGLTREPYSAIVTGKPLTETVEVHKLVDLQTRLVDDLKVKEGYLEVTDADGNKYYEKIYSGQTIADFMTDMGNLGIQTSLDEETGILTITGGAFKTLSDADVEALVANKTIVEPDSRYHHGTNLLACLYGADTISTDQITVASTYSKTKALRQTVTNTINATKNTTLDKLGLSANGNAIFDVRGESRTINLTTTMTISDLMEQLKDAGIGSSFDEDTSRLTIENATITGGTSDLATVLDLTTTISGKYVTSSELYVSDTVTIDATRDTLLKDYGISDTMSEADRTVTIYNSDGSVAATTVVGEGTTIGDLMDFINNQTGISASLKDGFLTINNGYIENATLEASMGLSASNKNSYVLGSIMTVTTTAAVTGETTLSSIFATIGTLDKVKDGYNLKFNDKDIEVSASTTLNELINAIYENGGTASLDHTGRLSVEGGTLTGSVAEALGITSYTHTSSVSATGEKLYVTDNVYADRDTKLSDLGVTGDTSYTIYNSLGQATTTINLANTATIGDFLDGLKANGIDGIIANGVIKLDSAEGNYIQGELATTLGLSTITVTEVVSTTQMSTAQVKHTATVAADLTTKLGDIFKEAGGSWSATPFSLTICNANREIIYDNTIPFDENSTIGDFFDLLKQYDIIGSINNGVISLYSPSGNYIDTRVGTTPDGGLSIWNYMGINTVDGENRTMTVGTTVTSTIAVTYTQDVKATEDSLISDYVEWTFQEEDIFNCLDMDIYDKDGNFIISLTGADERTTFGELFKWLSEYGIDADIHDGVIKLTSTNGNIVGGDMADLLGITTQTITTTRTVGASVMSTAAVTYTSTVAASLTTKVTDLMTSYKIDGTITASGVTGTIIGISTADDMVNLVKLINSGSTMAGKTFVLTDNIDMSGVTDWYKMHTNWYKYFSGTFDGQGYTISNLILSNTASNKGEMNSLFGQLSGATIKNLNLDNFFYSNSYTSSEWAYCGFLAYSANNSTISNVNVYAVAENGHVAGLINSVLGNTTIKDSTTDIVYRGTNYLFSSWQVSGLVGSTGNWDTNLTISGCSANLDASGYIFLGSGLVGYQGAYNNVNINISNSTVTGSISSLNRNSSNTSVSGICGAYLDKTATITSAPNINIDHCYVNADLSVDKGYVSYVTGGNNNIANGTMINVNASSVLYNGTMSVSGEGIKGAVNIGSYTKNGNFNPDSSLYTYTGTNVTTGTFSSTYANANGFSDVIWNSNGTLKTQASNSLLVMDKDGQAIASITVGTNDTMETLISKLSKYGNANLSTDGVLTFTGTDGNYITGPLADTLGISAVNAGTTTVTVGATMTSTVAITYTQTSTATLTTKLDDVLNTYKIDGTITSSGVTGTVIGISTADDLINLAKISQTTNLAGKTFVLTADINLNGTTFQGIGSYYGGKQFAGTFDGQGHTISNLNMSASNENVGLFNATNNATIKNFTISGATITATGSNASVISAGTVVGYGKGGSISNVKVTGLNGTATSTQTATVTTTGTNVNMGGIIGYAENLEITSCSSAGAITSKDGRNNIGGIAGEVDNKIDDSSLYITRNSSSINLMQNDYATGMMGGLIGFIRYDNNYMGKGVYIEDSLFNGTLATSSNTAIQSYTGYGALVGDVIGTFQYTNNLVLDITNCVYAGTGTALLGSFIGHAGQVNSSLTVPNGLKINIENSITSATGNAVGYSNEFVSVGASTTSSGTSGSTAVTKAKEYGYDPTIWNLSGSSLSIQAQNSYELSVIDPATNRITKSFTFNSDSTMQDIVTALSPYGNVSFKDGILSFEGNNNRVIAGGLAEALGITYTKTVTTTTVGQTVTSTVGITYTETITATTTTKLGTFCDPQIDGSITVSGVTGTVIGISTAQDLVNLAALSKSNNFSGKTFVLTNDIDMSSVSNWQMIGSSAYRFNGIFDGNNHTISGLNINVTENSSAGFFQFTNINSVVKNINLTDFTLNVADGLDNVRAGAVVGTADSTTLKNVNVEDLTINGGNSTNVEYGGIAGHLGNGTITNSSTSGIVYGSWTGFAGGAVGALSKNSSISVVESSMDFDSGQNAGGIVGYVGLDNNNQHATISDCLFEGLIGTSNGGGLVCAVYTYADNYQATLDIKNSVSYATGYNLLYDTSPGYNNSNTNSNTTVNINNCFGLALNSTLSVIGITSSAQTNTSGSQMLNIKNGSFLTNPDLLLRPAMQNAGYDQSIWQNITSSGTIDLKTSSNPYEFNIVDSTTGSLLFNTILTANSTIQDFMDELDKYGAVTFADGVLTFHGDNGAILSGGLAEAFGITVGSITTTTVTNLYNTSGTAIKKTQTTLLDRTDITFGELNSSFSSGYSAIRNSNGIVGTITVSASSTLDDWFTQLAAYDIHASLDSDGKVTIKPLGDNYIYTNSYSLSRALKMSTVTSTWRTVQTTTTYANTTSSVLAGNTLATIKTSTTVGELEGIGVDGVYGYVKVNDGHGNETTLTINYSSTIDDIFTKLAAFDILGTICNDADYGKVKFESKGDAYISDMTQGFDSLFKLKGQNPYTTSVKTSHTNTASKTLKTEKTGTITSDTSFGELGIRTTIFGVATPDLDIILDEDGNLDTDAMEKQDPDYASKISVQLFDYDNTLGDIFTWLASHNISASIANGYVTINDVNKAFGIDNNAEHNILLLIDGSDIQPILERLNLSTKQADYMTTKTSTTLANTTSDMLEETFTKTMTTSTTLRDLGVDTNTNSLKVSFTQDGKDITTVTFSPDDTIDDILTTLAGYGIAGQVIDGKISLTGNKHTYITNIGLALRNVLQLGDDLKYSTVITEETTVNTDSDRQTYEDANAKLTGDTILSSIDGFKNGNGSLIVHKTDGTFVTISVDASKTLDEFFEQISRYGIIGSVDSQGVVTITGVGNAYLQQDSNGSNILEALKLSNVVTNVKTVTVNRTSDTLSHVATVAAKGTTTLENLQDKTGQSINFDALGKAGLILHAYSDAGNTFVTLNFSKTDTIYDVIDKLAEYGIDARLDADGRFSVSSSTLTDFDLSGDLGDFLMGAYTKNYGEDTTHNVSTLLVERTITKMTDASKLADFGITGGDIRVIQEGKSYTVNVDMTKIKTIGDFRSLLAQYGFNSFIDDAGRLNVIGVGNSTLEQIDGGSNILDRLGLLDWTKGEITQSSNHLTDKTEVIRKISMSDKLKDLTNSAGVNLGITAGQIYVYQDGTRSTLNIDINDTLESLAAKLSQYGISVGISQEGKLYFDGNNDSYLTTDGIITANASNILQKIGISGNWETRYDSTSKNLSYTEDEDTRVNGSTKLKDLKDANGNNLGITTGSFYVYNSGVRNTETITEDMTVNDLMAKLAQYGLVADIDENGVISVGAYNNTYLATSALAGDNSNIVNALFEEWNFVNIYKSNHLDIPTDEVRAITRDTKLADINEGTYEAGYITVVKDGVKTNISLTADDTVGTLMDELGLYGFEAVINDKGQLMIKNTGDSLLQNYVGSEKASNALELLGIDLNSWINTSTYDSKTLEVTSTTTNDVNASRDTLLSELGVSTGEYYIYNNGVKYTAMISSDETLGSFMDTLKSFGIETSLVDGADGSVLTIIGKGDAYLKYIKESELKAGQSNVVEKLFGENTKEAYEYKGLEQTSSTTVIQNFATEDTLVSEFDKPWNGSTLASAGDLTVEVNGQKSTIKISADETFGSLLEKFRALGLEATMSKDGQIMIQSGYDTMTILQDGTTSNLLGNIGLTYQKDLGGYSASSTVLEATTSDIVEKTISVANYADGSTKMSLLNISDGSLTVYRDGQKATIQIKADETFDQLKTRLSTAFADLDLTFENGYLKIYSKDGKNVEVGSTTDTSNFSAITGIQKDENGNVMSARELYCVNGDSTITTSGIFRRGDVTKGTFTIGNAVFTIDDNTTLSGLIAQINSSDEANATAFWDNVDGQFVIKSRSTGAALVNIEAGTSNFTDIMGFTTSTWKNGAVESTKMNVGTQEIGDNAKIKINGTTYTATSNTITSDITRIKGLTINLKGLTKDSAVTLKVERDKETLANAVSGVVDSYNELMKNVDEAIASDGDLKNESTLKLIRNQLRNLMTSSDAGTTVFRNLDSIGISVAAASGNNIATTNSAIVSLAFDKDKFLKAYEADQDAVKELIIGGTNNKGIFTKVEDLVESTLKSVSGYFASTETSYANKIKDLDKKITKANKEVDRYKARLESKFQSMDMLIAQMQQQYSSFLTT